MVSTRYMYLRPGNLFKDFLIESHEETLTKAGKPKSEYVLQDRIIKGCLAEASPEMRARFAQLEHPITHTVVQRGKPLAKPGDKLILGERYFVVTGVDNADGLGITTLYYLEERMDAT